MRAALYVRVSTAGQNVENQLRELRAVARRRDWKVADVYSDDGISGSKGRDQRPALDRMLKDATRGSFDIVAAWSVDRLGRSVLHLAQLVNDLQAIGCALYLHQQGLDSTTPTGRAMLGMCSVFAEFEREQIRERTIAGMQRAKAEGKRIGRPSLPDDTHASIKSLARRRLSNRAIARQVGVSEASVRRLLKAAKRRAA
jgi:DNA invertase Pin-like site-specific DNA recombinase